MRPAFCNPQPLFWAVCLLVLCMTIRVTETRTCVQLDACRCQFDDDKSVVNLWPLGHRDGTPLFLDHLASDGIWYSYNPCYTFDEMQCRNSTICKISTTGETIAHVTNNGQDGSSFITYDGNNVVLGYQYQQAGRKTLSQVSFACDPSQNLPVFSIAKHVQGIIEQYYFQVITKCACPNAC